MKKQTNQIPQNSQPAEPAVNHNLTMDAQPSRHDRLLKLRYEMPHIPINTLPDWTMTFLMSPDQSANINLPADGALFMLTASDSAGLLLSTNGKPDAPKDLVTIDNLTAGTNINTDSLSGAVVNPVNILFDAVGISSIGLLSYNTVNLVSIWVWKNAE